MFNTLQKGILCNREECKLLVEEITLPNITFETVNLYIKQIIYIQCLEKYIPLDL